MSQSEEDERRGARHDRDAGRMQMSRERSGLTEEEIAGLLRDLRDPPESWIKAAKALPEAMSGIEAILERARRDEDFRASTLADLETALESEGIEPDPVRVAALRARMDEAG
jgi:hypothetical protein